MQPHRFEPSQKAAQSENIIAAVIALVAVPAFLYFLRGERNPTVLAVFAVLSGVATYVIYTVRARLKGLQAVEITDEGISLETKKERVALRWSQLAEARHTYYGGERWVFKTAPPENRSVTFFVDGYSAEDSERIQSLINERLNSRAA